MALARERAAQSAQADFFFGGCSDGHITSLFDLEEPVQPVVNFKAYSSSSSSVLSFEQGEEECAAWINMVDHHEYRRPGGPHGSRSARDTNCFEMTDGYGCQEDQFGLLYPSSSSGTANCPQEARSSQKRSFMGGGEMQAAKKLCGNDRKAKAKPPPPAKDPQSLAAKNRRERISDRLKVLQELVPNGTKVDLVTMLEKAISYVKFLQLQVKLSIRSREREADYNRNVGGCKWIVLATDEFWPAQGGKAPEVTQVKEAIDAILSSHRGRNSNSN